MPRFGNTDSSDSWLQLPEGTVTLDIIKVEDAPPSKRYPNTERLFIQYEVPDELQDEIESDGEGQQSYRVREYFGQTLGTPGRRSRFYDRVASIIGSKNAPLFDRWLAAGGEFDSDWLHYCRINAIITHTTDENGKTWANITGVVPDKQLQAANAKRLFDLIRADDQALYDQTIGAAVPVSNGMKARQPAKPVPGNVTVHPPVQEAELQEMDF